MSADDVTLSVVAKIREDIASAKARGLQTMLPGDAVESILDALEEAWTGRDAALKLAASHFGEVQRLWGELAARDAARVPQIGPLLLERIEVRTKGYVEMAAMLNDWIRANTIPALAPAPAPDVPELDADSLHALIDWTDSHRVRMQGTADRINAWFRERLPIHVPPTKEGGST